jgi:hypothetical protein
MPGIFEDLGLEIDFDEVPDAPDYEVEDGIYTFEIGDVFLKAYTDKRTRAEKNGMIIDFLLGDEGKKKGEFFRFPDDLTNPTAKEVADLSFWKQRLESLGFDKSQMNGVGRDDLIGLTGTLKLAHDKKTGKYQNVFDVVVTGAPEVSAPVRKTAPAATRPARAGGVKNPFAPKA